MKKFLLIGLLCVCVILSACAQSETDDASSETFEEKSEYTEKSEENSEYTETSEEKIEYTETAEDDNDKNEVSYESLPDPVMIEADFEVSTNPEGTFVITTNLPSETELSLTLKGKGYLAQGKAIVNDGVAISEKFTDKGKQLVGDFVLEVLMPIPSVQSDYVKHFIGERGEYLSGPYLKPALTSVVVSKEFNVSLTQDMENENISSDTQSSSRVYYRTPTGKKYHLDPDCGGKNSYETTNISDLTSCDKCAK